MPWMVEMVVCLERGEVSHAGSRSVDLREDFGECWERQEAAHYAPVVKRAISALFWSLENGGDEVLVVAKA